MEVDYFLFVCCFFLNNFSHVIKVVIDPSYDNILLIHKTPMFLLLHYISSQLVKTVTDMHF